MHKSKITKIITINLCIIIFLVIFTEFILSLISYNRHLKQVEPQYLKNYNFHTHIQDYKNELKNRYYFVFNDFENVHPKFSKYFDTNKFREVAYSTEKNAKDIILFGCSYTYGSHLQNSQAFHSKLSKYTNKNVYNYGIEAGSTREILHLLKNWEYVEVKPTVDNVEYVIYTFIDDHERRTLINLRPNVPNYEITDSEDFKYTPSKFRFLKATYLNEYICDLLHRHILYETAQKTLFLHIKEINNEINQIFSNKNEQTKLVILIYRKSDFLLDKIKELKNNNIIVIDIEDILNVNLKEKEYRMHDDHPNEKAWELIVPALVKELNL